MSRALFSRVLDFVLCFVHLLWLLQRSQAQTATATTDPVEARAVNAIFERWGISASNRWNLSGELCSGIATDSTNVDNVDYNPAIKCNCSFNNATICRVTKLKLYALNLVGTIPEELGNLKFLNDLNLGQNYLTGPLPTFIGSLTRMKYLSIGINALSGVLPKELGNLTELISLAFGSNNFSGSLPSELGKLRMLEQLYFDSSGVSGEIPSSFSNLQNMKTMWASDNLLTGRIPDFIGNWTQLFSLRLQGNSFNGPIPSTFSNLTLLNELRISDLSNGSSSLAFVKNMKALTILILRNNNISDTIPSDIGEYQSLEELDLSFNNLHGSLPIPLFSLSSLAYLFLGNNQLSGNLPPQKNVSLLNIDLSYNRFSGSLPLWVAEQGLQLNLVANNFTIDSLNNRLLSSGLYCLQRNFPCNRYPPQYSSFAIKCGGPKITSSNGTVFDMDNTTLGPASYFVSAGNRWAVSNVGRYAPFGNRLDAGYTRELFQTARLSPGSLRYYGLGLQNGHYTVTLQFAETDFPDTSTWQSLGRRVFNIYVQGKLEKKDFDIRKEAGGTFKAISREFNAQVSENFLEIHLFWAGKGTCCIPAQLTYGPSISAISVTPDFIPTVSNSPPNTMEKKKRTGLIVGIVVAVGVVCLSIFMIFSLIQRRKRHGSDGDEDILEIASRPNTFTYDELKSATEDFIPANKLGEGGFGPVYKGKLADGRIVAVKQLSVSSLQGKSQFVTEIATISAVQHRNLVKLYGCCIEGDKRLLVYEYLENKSLDQSIFGKSGLHINWPTRYGICLGTARGLAYLHEESRLRIVHRDIKASNILLDVDLNPKISDFGLAKLYDEKKTHMSTRVAGTIGYLAPEYAMRGHLTEKADVFGFGVVALEVLSGRRNYDMSLDEDKKYLLEWAWHLHENKKALELVDSTLSEFSEEEAKRMFGVSLLCIQALPNLRPRMSRVVAMLAGDIEVSTVTSKPGYLTDYQLNVPSSFVSEDTFRTTTDQVTNSQGDSSSSSSLLNKVVANYSPISTIEY